MERTPLLARAPQQSEPSSLRVTGGWAAVGGSPSRRTTPGGLATGVLVAPPHLVAETRVAFRRDALAFVEMAARDGRPTIDIDLGQTDAIDAGGLGILVLVQRRAQAGGLPTRLLRAREQVRRLLALTKLDYLFQFVD